MSHSPAEEQGIDERASLDESRRFVAVNRYLALAVRLGALLTLFLLIDRLLRSLGSLPEASYRQPTIVGELVRRVVTGAWLADAWAALGRGHRGILGAAIGSCFVAMVARYPSWWRHARALWSPWSTIVDGGAMRWLMLLVTFLLTWLASTYDFNLFFNQAHATDRILLVVLGALIVWRPVFVFPFLLLLLTVFHQFSYPFANNPAWYEVDLLAGALELFGASFLILVVTGRRESRDFVLMLCCLVASSYWGSGLGKLMLMWWSHPHLHLLIFGAYANGWLAGLQPSTIVSVSQTLAHGTIPMMAFTLLIEWGCIMLLLTRRVLLAFLVGFITFHVGVFLVMGMFFWKWIVLEGALILFLVRHRRLRRLDIVSRPAFVLSLVIIGGSPFWFHPRNLSWYDTPVSYAYRFEGIGRDGGRYRLSARTFTPYSDLFTLAPFPFLSDHPHLTGIWGISIDRAMARTLVGVTTPDEIFTLERRLPSPAPEVRAADRARFDDFMVRFFRALNARGSKDTILSVLQPPPHLWTLSAYDKLNGQEPIRQVIVSEVTFLFDGNKFYAIRDRRVREIEIP